MSTTLEWPSFYLMRAVIREHGARWQAALPQLTRPQYAALRVIDADPDIEQAELGQVISTDKATLAGVLLRLEKAGLIARTPDSDDRRRRRIRLTDDGELALSSADKVVGEINSGMLSRLTDDEQRQLHQLLTDMVERHDAD